MAWIIFAARVRRPLQKLSHPFKRGPQGEMAEWLKAHAWKACVRETVPWVRIPLSPPLFKIRHARALVECSALLQFFGSCGKSSPGIPPSRTDLHDRLHVDHRQRHDRNP